MSSTLEDTPVNMTVSVRPGDTRPSSRTRVMFRNVPTGASLSSGMKVGDNWIVPLESLPGLLLTPPPNMHGSFELILNATTISTNGEVTREGYISIEVEAVADPVSYEIRPTCFDTNQDLVPLNISIEGTDTDGSENITVLIAGTPDGISFSPSEYNRDGEYLIHYEDLNSLQFMLTNWTLPSFVVNVTVISMEIFNGDIWEETTEVTIGNCTTPTGSVSIHSYPYMTIRNC